MAVKDYLSKKNFALNAKGLNKSDLDKLKEKFPYMRELDLLRLIQNNDNSTLQNFLLSSPNFKLSTRFQELISNEKTPSSLLISVVKSKKTTKSGTKAATKTTSKSTTAKRTTRTNAKTKSPATAVTKSAALSTRAQAKKVETSAKKTTGPSATTKRKSVSTRAKVETQDSFSIKRGKVSRKELKSRKLNISRKVKFSRKPHKESSKKVYDLDILANSTTAHSLDVEKKRAKTTTKAVAKKSQGGQKARVTKVKTSPRVQGSKAAKKKSTTKPKKNLIQGIAGRMKFSEWLQSKTQTDAVKGSKKKAYPKDLKKLQTRLDKSLVKKDEVVSESLAKLYIKQGHPKKAIKVYQKLKLLNPQKSSFFAAQIRKLK